MLDQNRVYPKAWIKIITNADTKTLLYPINFLLSRYKIKKELFVAAEGMYTGQFVYCGRKVNLLDSYGVSYSVPTVLSSLLYGIVTDL
jgi:hypothetical protein